MVIKSWVLYIYVCVYIYIYIYIYVIYIYIYVSFDTISKLYNFEYKPIYYILLNNGTFLTIMIH